VRNMLARPVDSEIVDERAPWRVRDPAKSIHAA
jgi:hypothetical protein